MEDGFSGRLNPSKSPAHLNTMRVFYLVVVMLLTLALGVLEIAASHVTREVAPGNDPYWDEPAGIVLRAR
ncbi:MAG TPA: hypothetical protein VGT02_14280 [Methylomirabilota bacterium]|jgi:hypothetical protein|nr:hypothetical protein [Methylomirabilota bacterium]